MASIHLIKAFIFGSAAEKMGFTMQMIKFCKRKNLNLIVLFFLRRLERSYGVYIAPNAEIGFNVSFPHPVGIVIGDGVVIEDSCIVYQNVTLGGARLGDAKKRFYPQIGRGTVLFAGAKVLGNVKIGERCVIGANAVVTKDVPDDHVAVGVPAKVLPKKDYNDE